MGQSAGRSIVMAIHDHLLPNRMGDDDPAEQTGRQIGLALASGPGVAATTLKARLPGGAAGGYAAPLPTPGDPGKPHAAMPKPIRLLHLSDIHFSTRAAWDANPVLGHLSDFIAGEVADGLAPDLVAITGDLAQAGAPDEYALARAWLGKVWPRLTRVRFEKLPRDRLLLVPGNHDVDRRRVTASVQHIQDGLLKYASQPAIAELLADDDARAMVLSRGR
jgi:hypothetical protein